MASIVGIQYVLMFIAQCLSYCRVAIGKQRINFLFSLIDLSITIVLCVVGYHFTKDLFSIVTIMTVGKCIVYITDIVLDFVCMKSMAFKVAGILIGYVGLAWLLVVLI